MAAVDRHLRPVIQELLATFRVVHVGGARQTGKTTLVTDLLAPDPSILRGAVEDPVGFLAALPRPVVVDEFQRAGSDFVLAVKAAADRDRRRGQILLTGSAGSLSHGRPVETLAGRVGRTVLWPFSGGEIAGERECFIDRLLEPEAWPPVFRAPRHHREDVLAAVLRGGYPEIVVEGLEGRRRARWFESYVGDVIDREAVRPLVERTPRPELGRVLRLLAARTGQELVLSDVAADAEVSRQSVARYVEILEALHLVVVQPAWATSATTRAKRRPKVHLLDTGLAAALAGVGERELSALGEDRMLGPLLESHVALELMKQAGWSEASVDVMHFRDRNGAEVDVIVEDRRRGLIAGVEVKATSSPRAEQAKTLALLRDRLGERFTVGVVVHLGTSVLPLGERLWAVPLGLLWKAW